jgi:predicted dehydrogenase
VGLIHQAIDAGIHVLAEKPLAMTAGDTEQLADLATRNGVILCPVHQMSFQDGAIRATTDLPSIGDVSAIALRVFSAGGTGQALSALDQLVSEILPHPLSIVGAFWPNAGLNTARWSIHSSAPGELLVGGEHGGALLSIHISLSGRPPCFEMNIAGERGSIAIDFLHGYSIRFNGSVSRQQKILQPFKIGLAQFGAASANLAKRALRGESAYPGLRLLVGRFYAAVRGESASPISLQDTLLVAIAREAIQTALIQRQAGIASVPGNQSTFDEMARRDF